MVRLSILLPMAAGLEVARASTPRIPAFDVPSFDYTQLRSDDTPDRVLSALQDGGIVALRNIPNYVNVRERYLETAVDCALAMEGDGHSEHLSTKLFADGTRRLTLRANAGRELDELVETRALASQCPGYHEAYLEFSRTLERAIDSFAAALDDTPFMLSDGADILSSRKVVHDAVRLDHFHAYEAAAAPSGESERDLSLLLHEDHGLFIAMSAPEFFDVDAHGQATRRRLETDHSGLVIRSPSDGSVLRPVLKESELVLMMGTGMTQWLETTHSIPAVTHGMRMPAELVGTQAQGHRHLRAWFGKMTQLPSYQRMLQSRVAFDEFSNMTSRHLLRSPGTRDDEHEDLKTIGCAGGRRLVLSEGSCVARVCQPKPEYPNTFPSCANKCNYEQPSQSQIDQCAKKCDCTSTTTNAGSCWMVCAAWLPEDECPLDRQYCSGMVMKCGEPGQVLTPQPTHAPHTMNPVATPTTTPTTPTPTEAPTEAPPAPTTAAPTETPTEAPIETPTEAPIETPMGTPATPEPTTEEPVVPGGFC